MTAAQRRFALAFSLLIVFTASLALLDIQFRVERTLSLAVTGNTAATAGGGIDVDTASTRKTTELPGYARHVLFSAGLPDRESGPRLLRTTLRIDGEIDDIGPDAERPPVLATWFTRPDGSRQSVAPSPLGVGTMDGLVWQSIREWPVDSTSVVAAFFPRAARAELTLSDFAVDVLALTRHYLLLLGMLSLAWLGLAIVAIRHVSARLEGLAVLAPLVIATLIGVAVLLSDGFINEVVRPLVSLAHGTRGGVSLTRTFDIGHAVAFALLTASLLSVRRRLGLTALYCLMLTCLVAVGSEVAQMHLPARTAQVTDLMIDLSGVLAALLAYLAFVRWRACRRS